jgi:hypothetical protein
MPDCMHIYRSKEFFCSIYNVYQGKVEGRRKERKGENIPFISQISPQGGLCVKLMEECVPRQINILHRPIL